MPSPFPGMDPYLESPRFWRGIHYSLMHLFMTELNAHLPPQFVATLEERMYLSLPDGVYPDVALIYQTKPRPVLEGRGGAVAVAPDTATAFQFMDEEVYEPYIEVRTADRNEKVVAVVELISPKNKSRESNWRDAYLRKRDGFFRSPTHFLEIDLLRSGAHTLAVPRENMDGRFGDDWRYAACLRRWDADRTIEAWAVSMRERLPRVSVPLTADFPDAVIDLQAALTTMYANSGFDRRVDYTKPPIPTLTPDEATWADALLTERGLRS